MKTTKFLALGGLFSALVFLATYFTAIPIPSTGGYFNLGDSIILTAAILFGPKIGFVCGAIGSSLSDLLAGYVIFAPLTFVVKGVEGLIAGYIMKRITENMAGKEMKILIPVLVSSITGALFMAIGYFTGEATVLTLFDKTMGLTKAVTELPLNLLQGGLSVIVAVVLSGILRRLRVNSSL